LGSGEGVSISAMSLAVGSIFSIALARYRRQCRSGAASAGLRCIRTAGSLPAGRDIVHVSLADHSMRVLLAQIAAEGAVGFNDLTTDIRGRVYTGSIAFAVFKAQDMKPGNLYVIDGAGKARQISDGVLLTNGLGFSPGWPAASITPMPCES
jgi:sugar lactone lactonase YvrE